MHQGACGDADSNEGIWSCAKSGTSATISAYHLLSWKSVQYGSKHELRLCFCEQLPQRFSRSSH